jgi:hypothetical protein
MFARRPPSVGILRGGPLLVMAGMAGTAAAVVVLIVLAAGSGPIVGSLIVVPLLILVSLPLIVRQAKTEGDRRVFWLLVGALLLKLFGAFLNYFISFDVYGGVADAAGYHSSGLELAEQFRTGDFDTGLDPLIGTNFVRLLTGVVYAVLGANILVGFLVFAWLGFLGLLFFYRAFRVAVPDGRSRTYLLLLFFLPSLIYWPSTIGKEAWMTFALGVAAFGAARLLSDRTWRGLVICGGGLWLASLVRPHVAGLMAIALVGGYLFKRGRRDLGIFAPMAKGVALIALVAMAVVLVQRTDRFIQQEHSVTTASGVRALLYQTSELTSIDRSRFAPSVLDSPSRAPIAAATVLFRPHLLEVTDARTLAAALETAFLLTLCLVRWRLWLSTLSSLRRQPYVGFAVLYIALFVVAFSAIANFGLLARERVQVLPLFLLPMCVPPARKLESPDEAGS